MLRLGLALAVGLGTAGISHAADTAWTVERLTKEGWEIAGLTGASDIRASLILFRHRDKAFLVECSTFYDVTRSARVTVNCYELH